MPHVTWTLAVFFLKKCSGQYCMNMFSFRSSHRRCSVKNVVLKNFANFKGKHLYWSLFLTKLQTWRSLLKRDFNKSAKFLRNLFLEYLQTTASVVSFSWLSLPHVFFWSDSNWNGWKMVERMYSLSLLVFS